MVSCVAGGAAAGAAHALGEDVVTVAAAFQGVALASWMVRDAATSEGNRSLGKRVFGLELAYWDGCLPTRGHALLRNLYWAVLPVMAWHPLAALAGTLPFVFDGASLLFTPDARKVGDYMAGTRVVMERPGRADRMRDLTDRLEADQLRAEIQDAAPSLLADSRTGAEGGLHWHDALQAQLLKQHAADRPPAGTSRPHSPAAHPPPPDMTAMEGVVRGALSEIADGGKRLEGLERQVRAAAGLDASEPAGGPSTSAADSGLPERAPPLQDNAGGRLLTNKPRKLSSPLAGRGGDAP